MCTCAQCSFLPDTPGHSTHAHQPENWANEGIEGTCEIVYSKEKGQRLWVNWKGMMLSSSSQTLNRTHCDSVYLKLKNRRNEPILLANRTPAPSGR